MTTTLVEINGRTLTVEPLCGMTFARDVLTEGHAAVLVYEPPVIGRTAPVV